MGTIAIVAIAGCGVLWIAAVVEFARTMSELGRCRSLASRTLGAISGGR